MPLLEIAHERRQFLDTLNRHGVVHAGAHASQDTMTLETLQAGRRRVRQEYRIQVRVAQGEGDVHPGTRIVRHRILVQMRSVDCRVQRRCLESIALADPLHAAGVLQPLEYQSCHVPGKCRWGIQHGVVTCDRFVVKHVGRVGTCVSDEIFAHNDDRQSGRPDVLLRARINQPEFRHIDRSRQNAG